MTEFKVGDIVYCGCCGPEYPSKIKEIKENVVYLTVLKGETRGHVYQSEVYMLCFDKDYLIEQEVKEWLNDEHSETNGDGQGSQP